MNTQKISYGVIITQQRAQSKVNIHTEVTVDINMHNMIQRVHTVHTTLVLAFRLHHVLTLIYISKIQR